jgi:hypothetical protein
MFSAHLTRLMTYAINIKHDERNEYISIVVVRGWQAVVLLADLYDADGEEPAFINDHNPPARSPSLLVLRSMAVPKQVAQRYLS